MDSERFLHVRRAMIAIDGGGTKTEFVLFTQNGTVLNRIKREGCNPNVCGISATLQILQSGIQALRPENTAISAIYAGCAGFASGNYKETAMHELQKLNPHIAVKCGTDIMNVISSVTAKKNCIAAICGTGTVVYAKEGETLHRMGGWGYLLDQGGSGFSIGRDALRAALDDREKSGKATLLTKLIEKELGTTVWESIGKIYSGGNSYVASFAPAAMKAYHAKDKIATEIVKKNAAAIAADITAVSRKYKCGNTVVISGGVVTKEPAYRSLIESYLPGKLKLTVPELPAVYGACVECAKFAAQPSKDFKKNFTGTYGLFN